MSNINDFIIEDGVLKEYTGSDVQVEIPEGVTALADEVFKNRLIESVVIPEGVVELGERAFYGCYLLENITIPESLKVIKIGCFAFCKALKKIAFPKEMTTWERRIFVECTSLEEVIMPESIDSVDKDLIVDCNNIKVLQCNGKLFSKFEQAVKDNVAIYWLIGKASYGKDLETAIQKYIARTKTRLFGMLPEDNAAAATKLLEYAKFELDDLDKFFAEYNDGAHPNVLAVLMDYKNKQFTVQEVEEHTTDQVEKTLGVKDRTLAEWKKIYKFKVVDNAVHISGYKGTDAVVIIPSSIDGMPVTTLADKAFNGNTFITSVIIPDSVTTIGKSVFRGCDLLTEIVIPDSVVEIGNCALCECALLETVKLPAHLKAIGLDLLARNGKLISVELPQEVEKIAGNAFLACYELKSVVIPDSVKTIGSCAFAGCYELEHVYIHGAKTKVDARTFEGSEKVIIHAPACSKAEACAKENDIPFEAL